MILRGWLKIGVAVTYGGGSRPNLKLSLTCQITEPSGDKIGNRDIELDPDRIRLNEFTDRGGHPIYPAILAAVTTLLDEKNIRIDSRTDLYPMQNGWICGEYQISSLG
jgi:hypothetical protein